MSMTLLQKHIKDVAKYQNAINTLIMHNQRMAQNIEGIERRPQKSMNVNRQLTILHQKRRENLRRIQSIKTSADGIHGRIRGIKNEQSVHSLLLRHTFYGKNVISILRGKEVKYFHVQFGLPLKSLNHVDTEYDAIVHPIDFKSVYMRKKPLRDVNDVIRNSGIILELKCKFLNRDCRGSQWNRHLLESKHTKVIYVCNHADIITATERNNIDGQFQKLRSMGHNIHIIHQNSMLINAICS